MEVIRPDTETFQEALGVWEVATAPRMAWGPLQVQAYQYLGTIERVVVRVTITERHDGVVGSPVGPEHSL